MPENIIGMNKLKAKLAKAQVALRGGRLGIAVFEAGEILRGEAQKNVTGGGVSTKKLNVATNRLRGSISTISIGKNAVKVGPQGVEYAEGWEFGMPGKVIRPVRRKALRFEIDGEIVFAQVTRVPAQRPRPYMAPALRTKRKEMIKRIRRVYTGPLKIGFAGSFR
jgi:hypothetical protein